MKINVIGTSGSGKSTVARGITQKLNIPYIQLDALFWRADWQGTPDDLFFAKIEAALAGKTDWVIDGNYKRTQSIKWRDVDMIVWVDYSFLRTLYQAVRRAAVRPGSRTKSGQEPATARRFVKAFSAEIRSSCGR